MIETLIKKGLLLGLMLSISVGPVIFSIIKQSISNGIKGGLAFILGVSASDITLVVIGNAFTELFRSLLTYKTPIKITNSVLLIALGIYTIFFKKTKINGTSRTPTIRFSKQEIIKIFLSGYLINTLNPGAIAFWITATTSFIAYSLLERTILFATCLTLVFIFDIIKVVLAGKIRQKLTTKVIHIINVLSGIILLGFGIAVIWRLLLDL